MESGQGHTVHYLTITPSFLGRRDGAMTMTRQYDSTWRWCNDDCMMAMKRCSIAPSLSRHRTIVIAPLHHRATDIFAHALFAENCDRITLQSLVVMSYLSLIKHPACLYKKHWVFLNYTFQSICLLDLKINATRTELQEVESHYNVHVCSIFTRSKH